MTIKQNLTTKQLSHAQGIYESNRKYYVNMLKKYLRDIISNQSYYYVEFVICKLILIRTFYIQVESKVCNDILYIKEESFEPLTVRAVLLRKPHRMQLILLPPSTGLKSLNYMYTYVQYLNGSLRIYLFVVRSSVRLFSSSH